MTLVFYLVSIILSKFCDFDSRLVQSSDSGVKGPTNDLSFMTILGSPDLISYLGGCKLSPYYLVLNLKLESFKCGL